MKFLHALSIGVLCAIGAHFGQRLYRMFFLAIVIASELSAQIKLGTPGSPRGWLYIDTSSVWQKKVEPDKPWMAQFKPPWIFEQYWWETSVCQRMSTNNREYKAIRWYFVNLPAFGNSTPFSPAFSGYTLSDSMAIFLAIRQMKSKVLVMHEMTHVMMHLRGEEPGHPKNRYGPHGCGFRYDAPVLPPMPTIRPSIEDSTLRIFKVPHASELPPFPLDLFYSTGKHPKSRGVRNLLAEVIDPIDAKQGSVWH